MKTPQKLIILSFLLAFAACTSLNKDVSTTPTVPAFQFPVMETTAKAGDNIFCPFYNSIKDLAVRGSDQTAVVWQISKMSQPGAETSQVEFLDNKIEAIPNICIIPIPTGAKAKKGDIVLTWWNFAIGLNRAIVVDDKTPAEPIVRYLEISFETLVRSPDGLTPIAQMDQKLKPDTFIVLKNSMQPGAMVAIQEGEKLKYGRIINVTGNKIFVLKHAGRIGVYEQAECKPVPIVPKVKVGDRVKAIRSANFEEATVTKVDDKIGRVLVKFDDMTDVKAIAFGNVLPN